MDKKFDFKYITLVPETISSISSRSEIDIYTDEGNLPLMVSPMDTVIDLANSNLFKNKGYSICYPRGLAPFYQGFQSMSLDDFEKLIETKCSVLPKILVDIANGHMEKLYELSKKFMELYPYGELMIGNIANPKTYEKFAEIGVKYIRVGIGGGSGCLTSANTGVAPTYLTAFAVATHVKSGTITSSPGPISSAQSPKCKALVQLSVGIAYLDCT